MACEASRLQIGAANFNQRGGAAQSNVSPLEQSPLIGRQSPPRMKSAEDKVGHCPPGEKYPGAIIDGLSLRPIKSAADFFLNPNPNPNSNPNPKLGLGLGLGLVTLTLTLLLAKTQG